MIHFPTQAKRHFDPIAQQSGMVCVASDDSRVRYDNARAYLIVSHDGRRSYEISVDFGRNGARGQGAEFSLAEVLRLRGVDDAAFVSGLMISDPARLCTVLEKLARLTAQHAREYLAGDEFSFAQLQGVRRRDAKDFELQARLRRTRSALEISWRAKDFDAVVGALAPMKAWLTAAEIQKLEYARARLQHR